MPAAQARAKEGFEAAGLVKPVHFEGLIESISPKYGDVDSIRRPPEKGAFRALAMEGALDRAIDRQGQQCIGISPNDAQALGITDNAMVSARVGAGSVSSRPGSWCAWCLPRNSGGAPLSLTS
jgi:hypothetical protein